MKYRFRRRLYSHNFLHDPKLINKLIRNSSIGKDDTVLEIGPGGGIITHELLNTAKEVIAVELDKYFCNQLIGRFKSRSNFVLHRGNVLNFTFPKYSYKVFANIPFSITSDIINKLTSDTNMHEAYLIVQKEAAMKFIGKPCALKNSMVSILLKPKFEISICWIFNRWNFIPKPNIDIVMIRIKRREKPLIQSYLENDYKNYTVYVYNRFKVAKMDFDKFLTYFYHYINNSSPHLKKIISSKAKKTFFEQKMLHKIHRTRTDRNWRKYYDASKSNNI